MTISKFAFPTTIHFGTGASALVADYLESLDVERPLIVTDRLLAPLPVATKFAHQLAERGLSVQVFSGIWGNPLASMVGGASVITFPVLLTVGLTPVVEEAIPEISSHRSQRVKRKGRHIRRPSG